MNSKADDLSKWAPQGESLYGTKPQELNPFKFPIPTSDTAGLVCFGPKIKKPDFKALMRVLDVSDGVRTGYKFFELESQNPIQERYLRQLRLVSDFGLQFAFDEKENVPGPYESSHERMWQFMQEEISKYGTCFGNEAIAGKAGGDGDYEQEALGFGFMVENSYYGIYRIWSRAWLCTK
jgi:hypothetical protein